jgi:SNF2 family DNA or RNA helicase
LPQKIPVINQLSVTHSSTSRITLPSLGKTVDVRLDLINEEPECSIRLSVYLSDARNNLPEQVQSGTFSLSRNGTSCELLARNVPAVVELLLERDGLARSDFLEGRTATFVIEARRTRVLGQEPKPSSLRDYVLARATAADFVVPFLIRPSSSLPLFPYQRDGTTWLYHKERGILADDMGLGKTLQAIAAVRLLLADLHITSVLVVCPRSLLSNWENELAKWAPEIRVVRMVPAPAIGAKAWQTVIGYAHILLTSYEQIRMPAAVLVERGVDLVIADEAHRIRNAKSLTAMGIRNVRTKRFWALTGTPIERDTYDLSTIMSIISPLTASPSDAAFSPAFVRSIARPFVLRRLKSQVLAELPPVFDHREVIDLGNKQGRAYKLTLERFSKRMDDSQVFALITRLRQICDYDPETKESSKADRIMEILTDIRTADEKAILFSTFIEPLQIMRSILTKGFGPDCFRLLLGDQDLEVRRAAVTDFKRRTGVRFLLASSRVGGEGLTLTEANHVIFFNEWWNPSANEQARDRVVRLGQTKSVMVYTFVCRNTVEELLVDILQTKQMTFDDVVNALAVSETDPSVSEVQRHIKQSLLRYRP